MKYMNKIYMFSPRITICNSVGDIIYGNIPLSERINYSSGIDSRIMK